MNLKQITPDRFTNSRLFLHEAPGRKLLIKVFLGENREQRKELEARKMSHWKDAGFCVPGLIDLQLPDVLEPYLAMEFIPGDTLKDFLTGTTALEQRLGVLSDIFRLNYKRHMLVRSHQDLLLVHTDPNTDNLIVSGSDCYFIDFEHASRITDVPCA